MLRINSTGLLGYSATSPAASVPPNDPDRGCPIGPPEGRALHSTLPTDCGEPPSQAVTASARRISEGATRRRSLARLWANGWHGGIDSVSGFRDKWIICLLLRVSRGGLRRIASWPRLAVRRIAMRLTNEVVLILERHHAQHPPRPTIALSRWSARRRREDRWS